MRRSSERNEAISESSQTHLQPSSHDGEPGWYCPGRGSCALVAGRLRRPQPETFRGAIRDNRRHGAGRAAPDFRNGQRFGDLRVAREQVRPALRGDRRPRARNPRQPRRPGESGTSGHSTRFQAGGNGSSAEALPARGAQLVPAPAAAIAPVRGWGRGRCGSAGGGNGSCPGADPPRIAHDTFAHRRGDRSDRLQTGPDAGHQRGPNRGRGLAGRRGRRRAATGSRPFAARPRCGAGAHGPGRHRHPVRSSQGPKMEAPQARTGRAGGPGGFRQGDLRRASCRSADRQPARPHSDRQP